MTHPLTPREKVEPSLDDLLEQASEMMAKWTPEERAAHFEAQKKAIVAAEMAIGDEGTRTVSASALASGSGDHAELADRLLNVSLRWDDADQEREEASRAITALIAEVAALRGEVETLTTAGIVEVAVRNPSVSDYVQHWEARATEAERKLAEADRAARQIVELKIPPGNDPEQRLKLLSLLAKAQVLARTFLSKEAERDRV